MEWQLYSRALHVVGVPVHGQQRHYFTHSDSVPRQEQNLSFPILHSKEKYECQCTNGLPFAIVGGSPCSKGYTRD